MIQLIDKLFIFSFSYFLYSAFNTTQQF